MKSPTRFTAVAHTFVSGRCHKVHQKALGTKLSGSAAGERAAEESIHLDQILLRAESGNVPTRTIFAFDETIFASQL